MMRVCVVSFLLTLGFGPLQTAAFAQSAEVSSAELTILGGGLFLEIVPEKFVTVKNETPAEYLKPQWVTIPATFETVTVTVVVQEAYPVLNITPAEISADGMVLTKAIASVERVPAVTKNVSRRVVKTPARLVKRVPANMYNAGNRRELVSGETYIIRDESGAELQRYENPAALADFVNGL